MPRQKFKYLENKKSFWDEIKSIFHYFWRAIIKKNFFFGRWESDFEGKISNLMERSCCFWYYNKYLQKWSILLLKIFFKPFQDGEGDGTTTPPILTNFSPVTSANVGISPQNFLTFSFNPFATLVQNFKAIRRASPKLLNFERRPPCKKKWFFWSNPYNTEVMITSLREMLELPNFGHMTTFTI